MLGIYHAKEVDIDILEVNRWDASEQYASGLLGPGVVLILFFALALVSGVCYGLNFVARHPHAKSTLTVKYAVPVSAKPASGAAKPSAATQMAATATKSEAIVPPAVDPSLEDWQPGDSTAKASATASGTASSTKAQASGNSSKGMMVQVAVISHQEDADTLVTALRRRGYNVAVSYSSDDKQLHVRVGPFKSRDEVEKWRKKLISDGYNAVVQP